MNEPKPTLTTREFARKNGVQPDTVRVQLCRQGHYFGIKPQKLPNSRLLWPDAHIGDKTEGQ